MFDRTISLKIFNGNVLDNDWSTKLFHATSPHMGSTIEFVYIINQIFSNPGECFTNFTNLNHLLKLSNFTE